MRLAIVGADGRRFTPNGASAAYALIDHTISTSGADTIVSGACHLGGVDIWAAQIGRNLRLKVVEFPPAFLGWAAYKERDMLIAENCDSLAYFAVDKLPNGKSLYCYHCDTEEHVRSGGCWTAKYARSIGKPTTLYVVYQ